MCTSLPQHRHCGGTGHRRRRPGEPPRRSSPEPVVLREADGHVVVRATRITEPSVLDGELKEEVYARVPLIDGFLQQEPVGRRARDRADARLAVLRRSQHLRVGAPVRLRAGPRSHQRDAPRRAGHQRQRKLRRGVRHLSRPPQRLPLPGEPRRRTLRRVHHRRARHEPRLEHGVGRADRPRARGLDRRNGDPLQVAALSRPARPSGASTSSAS